MSNEIYGIKQEEQRCNLLDSIEFLEKYIGAYNMDSHSNCLLCILKRGMKYPSHSFQDYDDKGFSEFTGIPSARVNVLFCSSPEYASYLYHCPRNDVQKNQVIAELWKEYKNLYGDLETERDNTFSKKDLKSGMFVVEHQGFVFQVVGEVLVPIGSSRVHALKKMNNDMTFPNFMCNVIKVFEPCDVPCFNPKNFCEDSPGYKKVYDRNEVEDKKRMKAEKEQRRVELYKQMEELEEKLKIVRGDFEKEFDGE